MQWDKSGTKCDEANKNGGTAAAVEVYDLLKS